MSDTVIQVRINSNVRDQVEAIFAKMGMKTTEAIRMFLQQTINDEALPFHPHIKKPNKRTLKSFDEIDKGDYTDSSLEDFKKSLET